MAMKTESRRRKVSLDDSSRFYGNHFCDERKVEAWKPCWKNPKSKTNNFSTIFRVLPGIHPDSETKKFDDFRFSDAPLDFGACVQSYWAWLGGGGITFLLDREEYDRNENPAALLYFGLQNAKKRGQDRGVGSLAWAGLLEGGEGTRAVIPRPNKLYVVQCLLLKHGDEDFDPIRGSGARDKIVLLGMTTGAGKALCKLMDEMTVDPVSVAPGDGAFFCLYLLGNDPRELQQAQTQQRTSRSFGGSRRESSGGRKEDKKEIGFGVYSMQDVDGLSPDLSEYADDLLARCYDWDDVLFFPDHDAQAALLAGIKEIPYDVLEYCWQDFPGWLPDRSSDKARESRGATDVAPGWSGAEGDVQEAEPEEAPAAQTRRSWGQKPSGAAAQPKRTQPGKQDVALADEEAPFDEDEDTPAEDVEDGTDEFTEAEADETQDAVQDDVQVEEAPAKQAPRAKREVSGGEFDEPAAPGARAKAAIARLKAAQNKVASST